jgi:FG-GAP-like repeat
MKPPIWVVGLASAMVGCSTSARPRSCSIDGALFNVGSLNPANPCQICRPESRAKDWSEVAAGSPCGDGGAFCFSGTCEPGCLIPPIFYTAPGAPNPSAPCQSCQPDRDALGWSPRVGVASSGECPQGQYCGSEGCRAGCFIQGRALSAGDVDLQNACQSCQPISSPGNWTSLPDGLACGAGTLCLAGNCEPACLVAGQVYSAGGFDPANGCLVCSPDRSPVAWSPFSGLAVGGDCDGGPVCDRGACRKACFIGGVVVSDQVPAPGDSCRACLPASSATGWSPFTGLPPGGCDGGTVCSGGQCAVGCFIGGQFFTPGQAPAGNTSRCCGPRSSPSEWSTVFSAGGTYEISGACPMVAGDFNGDGFVDLAAACLQDYVDIFFNLGSGRFGGPTLVPGGCSSSPVAGDLNADGITDLICLQTGPARLSFWVSQPDAGFVVTTLTRTGYEVGLATADFNGDGIVDLLVTRTIGFGVLMGIGDGGFLPEVDYDLDAGFNFIGGVAADFDGDGLPDVVIQGIDPSPHLMLSLSQGGGLLGPAHPVDLGDSAYLVANGLVAGDFNADSRADLAVAFGDRIAVLLGQPGGFGPSSSLSVSATSGLIAGDFNGDGRLDLLALNSNGTGLVAGAGDGTFFQSSFFAISGERLVAANFRGNGTLDLAALNPGGAAASWTLWQNGCH